MLPRNVNGPSFLCKKVCHKNSTYVTDLRKLSDQRKQQTLYCHVCFSYAMSAGRCCFGMLMFLKKINLCHNVYKQYVFQPDHVGKVVITLDSKSTALGWGL